MIDMAIPPVIKLDGDLDSADELRGFALSQLRILQNQMTFQGLKQDLRRIKFNNGTVIQCGSAFGIDTISIYVPPVAVVVEAEEEFPVNKFWIRPQIDGNDCILGGQQFYVEYKNMAGDWITTDTKPVRGYDGGGDTKLYHYCGPFEFTNRDTLQPVRVYLEALKDVTLADPVIDPNDPVKTVGGIEYREIDYNFKYYTEDNDGIYQVYIVKYGMGTSIRQTGDAPLYRSWLIAADGCGSYISEYCMARMSHCICLMADRTGSVADPSVAPNTRYDFDPSSDAEESWFGSLPYQWYKSLAQRYSLVESIYKEFTGSAFDSELENAEAQIYDYDAEEYVENPIVINYDFTFGLKGKKRTVPDDWDTATSMVVHSLSEIFEIDTSRSADDYLTDKSIYFGEICSRADNSSMTTEQLMESFTPENAHYSSSFIYGLLGWSTYRVEKHYTDGDDNSWARGINSPAWLFDAVKTMHNIETFFEGETLVHVVTGTEEPTPSNVGATGVLARTWGVHCYGSEEGESKDLGGSNNTFSCESETLPVYYF